MEYYTINKKEGFLSAAISKTKNLLFKRYETAAQSGEMLSYYNYFHPFLCF